MSLPLWITPQELEQASLAGLFVYSFLAATILPGGSEVLLFALISNRPEQFWGAILIATAGNTAGGLTSYACGRILPGQQRVERHAAVLRRFGSPVLLLAWVPFIGDLLCVAAGWLRINWIACSAYMAVGKLFRYWFVAHAALLAQ